MCHRSEICLKANVIVLKEIPVALDTLSERERSGAQTPLKQMGSVCSVGISSSGALLKDSKRSQYSQFPCRGRLHGGVFPGVQDADINPEPEHIKKRRGCVCMWGEGGVS